MFAFDFDEMDAEGEARAGDQTSGRQRTTVGGAKAQAKGKAKAKPRPAAKGDFLSQLAAAEAANAAMMLEKFAPGMPGPAVALPPARTSGGLAPTGAAVAAPPLSAKAPVQSLLPPPPVPSPAPQQPRVAVSRPAARVEAAPAPQRAPQRAPEPAPQPCEGAEPRIACHGGKEELPEAAQRELEEEAAARAAAEAAVELSIKEARSSGWWRRLEGPQEAAPVERCGELSLNGAHIGVAREALNPLHLPTQEFVVQHEMVSIRAKPCLESVVRGAKRLGERLRATEETFDGWVHLADEPGWVLRDHAAPRSAAGSSASGTPPALPPPLVPLGGTAALLQALAAPDLAWAPGRQMFEVLAESGVGVYREPAAGALQLGSRSFGEFVLAEAQSYHRWVRLTDNDGWMPAFGNASEGRMLLCVRPDELQLAPALQLREGGGAAEAGGVSADEQAAAEAALAAAAAAQQEAARREALRALEAAAAGGASTAVFCAALEVARQSGVARRDIARCNALRSAQ